MNPSKSYRVTLSDSAEADLEHIHAYLVGQGASEAADKLIGALLDSIKALNDFPFRGSVPREFEAMGVSIFRQIVMPPYRIFYDVDDPDVTVLLIADGRRDVRVLLQQLLIKQRPEHQ